MITAYLKPKCPISQGVEAALKRLNVPYQVINTESSENTEKAMRQHFGEASAPCVEINGLRFPETTGAEVEKYLISEGLAQAPVLASAEGSADSQELLHRRIARANTQRFF